MRRYVLALCLSTTAACAGGLATHYAERRFGRSGGYSSVAMGPARWRIEGLSTAFTAPDFAQNMALYRGAVLAKAAGFSYMQVTNFWICTEDFYGSRGNQYAGLTITAVNDSNAPLDCVASEYFRANCRTLDVDRMLAELGPPLNQTPAQTATEIEAARSAPARQDLSPPPPACS